MVIVNEDKNSIKDVKVFREEHVDSDPFLLGKELIDYLDKIIIRKYFTPTYNIELFKNKGIIKYFQN